MANTDELSCVYATLILADDQVVITGDKMATILQAANLSVEPYWPGLFSKALEGLNVKELISNVGSSAGSGPAAVPGAAASGAGDGKHAAAEAKKEEKKEESDEDMEFGLFD